MKTPDTLLNSVRQCLAEPVFDIQKNFSLEKSKLHYEKRVKQWDNWNYKQNPAAKLTKEAFPYANLKEMSKVAEEAHSLCVNLKDMSFVKGVDWGTYGQNIVVSWYRLKTFEEWLHDGLKDALIMACDCPEDGARMILESELWKGNYTNTMVHMFAEWKIDKEILKRLWQYEKYIPIEGLDIEKAIDRCKELLSSEEEKDVTVLTFKM